MFRHKNRFILSGLVLLAALFAWLAIYGAGALVQARMEKFLARHGIGEAIIASSGHGSGGQIVFSDIRLDPDGFSTIEAISARVHWPFFLFSERPFSEIAIDHLALTGEIDEDGRPHFAGINLASLLPLAETDSLIMKAGQADVSTPIGALRLEMKYRMTRQPDDSQKIEAALWSDQLQMKLDTRWTGRIAPAGKWAASAELREARLNLPHFILSRASGWLAFEGAALGLSAVNGQIEAGQLRIGEKSAFGDIAMTVEGPYDASHVILHGDVSAFKNMVVSADMKRAGAGWQVHASVEAKKIDDLVSFLQNLHNDLQLAAPHSAALTTLLITPGNLERIRAEAGKITYDSAELMIDGATGNLKGRIVMRWNGGAETGVISMNPGEAVISR